MSELTFGPNDTFQQVAADPTAARILRQHIPGAFDDPDSFLQPYAHIGDFVTRFRPIGEAAPSNEALWAELATVRRPVPATSVAPRPPTGNYESDEVAEASAQLTIAGDLERWGTAELIIQGPEHGNPFTDVELSAEFRNATSTVTVGGFYDGAGTYRIRFLPPDDGRWNFQTRSNARSLHGIQGGFEVGSPGPANHGRVVVRDAYHFAHEDGSAHLPLGTTAYAWTHQPVDVQERTLETLRSTAFTKLRMCVFPKSFVYNTIDPGLFPFERGPAGGWDFTRPNVEFYRRLERRVVDLRDLGVEADLILFHPYDRWGFSRMPAWADQLYVTYVVRRLAHLRNVWWSLANEYDFMPAKNLHDWETIAATVVREDHADHLISIHNGFVLYDFTQPWVTHCSIQKNDTNNVASNVDDWRRFGKPVVIDEIGYEGDLAWAWGNLTGPELVQRAWNAAIRGGYVNHGETYEGENIWWSHGGTLVGETAERFAFLARIIAETPTGYFEPLTNDFDFPWGGDADHRLVYFGTARPARRSFRLPPGTWSVDVIDTWQMTIQTVTNSAQGELDLKLPGTADIAVRFRRHQDNGAEHRP